MLPVTTTTASPLTLLCFQIYMLPNRFTAAWRLPATRRLLLQVVEEPCCSLSICSSCSHSLLRSRWRSSSKTSAYKALRMCWSSGRASLLCPAKSTSALLLPWSCPLRMCHRHWGGTWWHYVNTIWPFDSFLMYVEAQYVHHWNQICTLEALEAMMYQEIFVYLETSSILFWKQ